MVLMWTCPFCGGRTKPISIDEVNAQNLSEVLREIGKKENPVIVKCLKCGEIWVDEL